jgi:transcriptional regulator with XRE-family HTH domain
MEAGMTQDDLARAMGYKDRSMITKIESGKVDISQTKVVEFAKVLNTTPGYLMGWDEAAFEEAFGRKAEEEKPKNDDVRLLLQEMNRMTPEQIEQVKGMFRIMFKLSEKGMKEDDA